MENIQIDTKFADKNGEIMIVRLGGHIDQSNSYLLQKQFDNIIDSGAFKIVVDFSSLRYMSSAGWGIFVGEVKRFRENGGDIKLAAMNSDINDVFQMLEFYHILEDYPTVVEATASFEQDNDILDIIEKKGATNPIYTDSPAHIDSETEQEEIEIPDKTGDTEKEEPSFIIKKDKKEAEVIKLIPGTSRKELPIRGTSNNFMAKTLKDDVKLSELPIHEKIKKVVQEHPLVSVFQIKKILKHEHFGFTKIGLFRLWKILKNLDLNSREKRYRFYRSC